MTENNEQMYDVIIVGGGPAGLSAAIYAMRAGLKTALVEKGAFGGQIVNTYEIKNYPGFKDINGAELANKMQQQAESLGINNIYDAVTKMDLIGDIKVIETQYSGVLKAKAVILSMGAAARKVGIEREEELTGMGVSYCAICDGAFFRNKNVAVIGGGNTAMEDLLYLESIAKKVYLINRTQKFRAQKVLVEAMNKISQKADAKIVRFLDSQVTKLIGSPMLEKIEITNKVLNTKEEVEVDGLFVAIGRNPSTELIRGVVNLDESGYIITDENMQTNIKGVYAAGDIRYKQVRQIITAASDGAVAATHINTQISK